MSKPFRRYEVLLPLRFNDGQRVGRELISEAISELRRQFGAVSNETQVIEGYWDTDRGGSGDDSVRVFVDVPDNEENRKFFVEFKERAKRRFHQQDLWITTHPLEVL